MALPGTLNDYLKQKAAGMLHAGFGLPSSTAQPVAPKLQPPSFSTAPPMNPAIATWDDVVLAARPVAPVRPTVADPSLPLAPVKSGFAATTPRFGADPARDNVTRTVQPEKPLVRERSTVFANTPAAPSIWDRASKLNQPAAPVQTTAQPQFGRWGDIAETTDRVTGPGFTPPAFTAPTFPRTTGFSDPGFSPPAFGSGPTSIATPQPNFPTSRAPAPFDAISVLSREPNATPATTAATAPTATTSFGYAPRLGTSLNSSTPLAALRSGPHSDATSVLERLRAGRPTNAAEPTTSVQPFDAVTAFTLQATTPFDAASAFRRPTTTPPGAGSNSGSPGILAQLQAGGSSSAGNGLSPAGQSILDNINRIVRDNNIGDFDRLGIRLGSLSDGIAAGLDDNIAQARFERVVEDAVSEGDILASPAFPEFPADFAWPIESEFESFAANASMGGWNPNASDALVNVSALFDVLSHWRDELPPNVRFEVDRMLSSLDHPVTLADLHYEVALWDSVAYRAGVAGDVNLYSWANVVRQTLAGVINASTGGEYAQVVNGLAATPGNHLQRVIMPEYAPEFSDWDTVVGNLFGLPTAEDTLAQALLRYPNGQPGLDQHGNLVFRTDPDADWQYIDRDGFSETQLLNLIGLRIPYLGVVNGLQRIRDGLLPDPEYDPLNASPMAGAVIPEIPTANTGIFVAPDVFLDPVDTMRLLGPSRREYEAYLPDEIIVNDGQIDISRVPDVMRWLDDKIANEPGHGWETFRDRLRLAVIESLTPGSPNTSGDVRQLLTIAGNISDDYVAQQIDWIVNYLAQ